MKALFYYLGLMVLIIIISVLVWRVGRVWNYNLSYKSMVEKTVIKLVKDDCLK